MTGITIINDGHGHHVFAVVEPLPGRKRHILCKQVEERWEVIARFENEEAADDFLELVPLLWRDRLVYRHGDGRTMERIVATDGNQGHWYTGEEIVRCMDCVHCRECDMRAYGGDRNRLLCHHFSMSSGAGWPVKPDGYCAWGERREA